MLAYRSEVIIIISSVLINVTGLVANKEHSNIFFEPFHLSFVYLLYYQEIFFFISMSSILIAE